MLSYSGGIINFICQSTTVMEYIFSSVFFIRMNFIFSLYLDTRMQSLKASKQKN
jgi:hypothetical protein